MENREQEILTELENLRRDYNDLKKELEKNERLNESRIKESIGKNLRSINNKRWISIPAGIMAICLLVPLSQRMGFRLPFTIISIAWIGGMVLGKLLEFFERSNLDRMSGSSTQEFLREIRRRRDTQLRRARFNFTLFAIWVGYFLAECVHTGMPRESLLSIIGGIAIGAIVGLSLGIRTHNRILGEYEEIILELENLETEKTS